MYKGKERARVRRNLKGEGPKARHDDGTNIWNWHVNEAQKLSLYANVNQHVWYNAP